MRLWHYSFLSILPKQQLVGQWRELMAIFSGKVISPLVNYVYKYDKLDWAIYIELLLRQYKLNNIKIKSFDKYYSYVSEDNWLLARELVSKDQNVSCFNQHQNDEYLKICCWNLLWKIIRGQKGFENISIEFILNVIRN